MRAQAELQRDLVLVGGGHSHALVLRMLAMNPIAGLRITLVSPASHTPYSGMLPGLVAGHYRFEQTHIDLSRLCQWAGVRFIASEVTALDPAARELTLLGRPPINYDLLSIDIGSQPELDSVPGARAHSVPVKPVAGLWQRWRELESRLQQAHTSHRVTVVGGGAGSVELALAMAHRLAQRPVAIALFCGAPQILQGYNRRARSAVMAALARHGVELHVDSRVARVEDEAIVLGDGSRHVYDDLFWCTGAAAAPWVAASGLACDERGFLLVDDSLRSVDDAAVFGAGDIASQFNHPRPKAGVYAVRQAPALAHNLRASLMGRPLRQHRPQQRFLSLLSLGDRQATADRAVFSASGRWVWHWKDRIDREFMGRFETLPAMEAGAGADALPGALEPAAKPHCGGCGAKVGATGLSAVLAALHGEFPEQVADPASGDDAVPIPGVAGETVLQSLDLLRQLVADPWLMGRIAANHALSDLYACGARPLSALAAITLPFAAGSLLERDLQQVLAGALYEFAKVDCILAGGHSMQGPELQLGFAVNGQLVADRALPKRGARPGDVLILTKPLGTGVLFAAHMQQGADGRDVAAAIEMMLQGNALAAELAAGAAVSACTDITGFGLLGHLLEMLLPGQGAALDLAGLPTLPGATALLAAGVRSTLHETNRASAQAALAGTAAAQEAPAQILFDPQTSGGLLLAAAPDRASELVASLCQGGYAQARVIGAVTAGPPAGRATVSLTWPPGGDRPLSGPALRAVVPRLSPPPHRRRPGRPQSLFVNRDRRGS
ncbi:selenide, water dikinase SelD [Seongchinamella sediminis]|uniref:Selenide, water dikinase SelD n=1 Tax=Seongchinamella sediminis TaxID=2283635 RepID=A0A3L7E4M3_9GAMM|nr:selenide, water dikinase SelD [Seongchinamella sediminis]RLQ23553.1 selenide, water dikinase SelD [Seongchinamella sediminis]